MGHDKLKELREERVELVDKFETLVENAKIRTLTNDEKSQERLLSAQIEVIQGKIEKLEGKENILKSKVLNKINEAEGITDEENTDKIFSFEIQKKVAVDTRKPIQDFVLRNYQVDEDLQKADVYKVLTALAAGHPRKGDIITGRAMDRVQKSATTTVMLTEFLSSQLLDGGLSHSHLARSGMNIFTMDEQTVRWVKISTYPTFEWKAELATTTDRTVVFTDETFTAKTLRGFINLSGEQLQDAHNIDKALRYACSRSIGNTIDSAGLFGSGTGAEPQGITNYAAVNNYDVNGHITSYDPFVYGMALIANDNGRPEENVNTSIMTPNAWREVMLLKDQNDNPLTRPPVLQNHRFLHTTKLPATQGAPANRTTVVMGGFNSLNLGVRLQTEIMFTPVQSDKFQYSMFVVFRGDFAPNREEDFAILTDVFAPDVTT